MTRQHPDIDYPVNFHAENHPEEEQTPIPQALVRMLPHGRAAHLAARVLAEAEAIEAALDLAIRAKGYGTPLGYVDAARVAELVQDFRHVLAQETSSMKDSPACAPLTGTSARSVIHTIADSILTMPEPKPEDGGWRQAAHDQVWRTGTRYTQTWKADAAYWAYTRDTPTGEI